MQCTLIKRLVNLLPSFIDDYLIRVTSYYCYCHYIAITKCGKY